MANTEQIPGAELVVQDVEAAACWLRDNLFFTDAVVPGWSGTALQNGACLLTIAAGEPTPVAPAEKGGYYTGLGHIALRAYDMEKAIRWCQSRGLSLELENGGAFFNPKVYGGGEQYFNIVSPFGVRFEVSRRVTAPGEEGRHTIAGLDHIGIPCADLAAELAWFGERGFTQEFEPVHNISVVDGAVGCCMTRRGDLVLELYQLEERKPLGAPENAALRCLRGFGAEERSPGGAAVGA